ncbi:MAG: N-acetylmuramoyl-L-alanine amidase [Chlorobiaceae bacterium]|nr:N-acetylmuramoyl-L-alanine amidase [Chlorobiaceae bacterium]
MQVSTASGQGYTIKVQGHRSGGVYMADVGSLARALRLGNAFDGSQMQIDESFSRQGTSCVLRQGSSFVLVASALGDTEKRVIQLTSSPEIQQGKMFLPVSQACRMLSLWFDREVIYDASTNRIKVTLWGQRQGASLHSVGVVGAEPAVELPPLPPPPPPPPPPPAVEPPQPPGPPEKQYYGQTVIDDVRVETLANGIVIRFSASGQKSAISFLRPDENGTAYLTVDKATGNLARLTKIFSDGAVKSITPLQLEAGGMQFTVLLNTASFVLKSSSFQYDSKNNDYVLYIMSNVNVEAIHRAEKERQIEHQLSQDVSKWKLDAVVIDAGHGGKDPGAIGTKGTKEKDVVLNIVNDLGMFVKQKWPDVKVIYTRKDDRFIPLNERGKIANRYGGKLFVSVHCNSTAGNTRVRGTEVYILGSHKTQAALDVAMFENSVITREENYKESYKGFSDEYLIMSSMAQSAFAMQSTELAQNVLRRLGRYGSNNGLGVRQAGFMVLWTPSMPSILVETGYLSNPDEEKILRDRREQTKIAYGIFQGLQQYRASYETRVIASGHAAAD